MFPEGSFVFDSALQPLSYKTLIREVFVRKAAVLLIQEDLAFDRAHAVKTLNRSQTFGTLYHPGDDSDHIQAIIEKTTRSVQ